MPETLARPETPPDSLSARLDRLLGEGKSGIVADELDRLEHSVHVLREAPMRRAIVAEHLRRRSPGEVVASLVLLLERSRKGNGRSRAVLQQLALEPQAFESLDYGTVQEAYRLAQACGLDGVARMFLGATLEQNPGIEEAFTGNAYLEIPLGERRAAARTHNRDRLDRLVHDRDFRVIRILLDNPRIVERDVVKIAAMRPTRPEVLSVVAAHPRWSTRVSVRKALACNPWTPAPIARRLLPTLMAQDLMHALESGVLPPELAREARNALRARQTPVIEVELPDPTIPELSASETDDTEAEEGQL
jgi:hypothetical protein